jgi:hypothetical protein
MEVYTLRTNSGTYRHINNNLPSKADPSSVQRAKNRNDYYLSRYGLTENEYKAKAPIIRGICEECGKAWEVKSLGSASKKKYCNRRCLHRAVKKRYHKKITSGLKAGKYIKNYCQVYFIPCKVCKNITTHRTKKGKYCSKACYREYYLSKPVTNANCKWCNTAFQPSNKANLLFCSKECGKRSWASKSKNKLKARIQQRARNKGNSNLLTDKYVRYLISKTTPLTYKESQNVPNHVIELKRQNLIIKRLIK